MPRSRSRSRSICTSMSLDSGDGPPGKGVERGRFGVARRRGRSEKDVCHRL